MEKWKVYRNCLNGEDVYIVGRRIRTDEPLHSGNFETASNYMKDRDAAGAIAAKLNEEEE